VLGKNIKISIFNLATELSTSGEIVHTQKRLARQDTAGLADVYIPQRKLFSMFA
jgi:hypothetical protein